MNDCYNDYNINARYRVLNQPGVVIKKDDNSFAAIISLIEPEDK